MTRRLIPARFFGDKGGVTAIEFALVAPVLLVMLMGFLDLGYNMYTRSLLVGAVQKAARDSTLESGPAQLSALDAKVTAMVRLPARNATLTFTRQNYESFANVGKPEDFTDKNGNSIRDPGECYTDSNGNGQWNADRGTNGQGGADDVTRYTVKMEYPRVFPLAKMIGLPAKQIVETTTVLKNQPYTGQTARPSAVLCA